jgi:hypothetical protein
MHFTFYFFFQIGENINFRRCSIRRQTELEGEAVCFIGLVSQGNCAGKSFYLTWSPTAYIWAAMLNLVLCSFGPKLYL